MINKLNKNYIIVLLVLVTVLGFIVRYYGVGEGPGGLNRDEAALAYNSYLLSETGRDEWGRRFPISLESFGDFKLIGYPLAVLPFFKIIELENFSDLIVRLPSIIAGTLLIPFSFYFARRLQLSMNWSLLFSFLIATTPLFIFYSRFAFEANLALTLLVCSLLFLTKQHKNSIVSNLSKLLGIIVYYAALCTYNTPLLLLPALMFIIIFIYGTNNWKKMFFPLLGICIVALFFLYQTQDLLQQKKGITVFSDATVFSLYPAYRERFSGLSQTLLGNTTSYYAFIVTENVMRTFSPKFLALQGGAHPWHSLSGYGHLFRFEYILTAAGIITLVITSIGIAIQSNNKTGRKGILISLIIFILIEILAVLPSAVTVDAPHATRSLFAIYFLLFIAMSGYQLLLSQKSWKVSYMLKRFRLPLLGLVIVVQLTNTVIFVSQLNTEHRSHVAISIFPGLSEFLTMYSAGLTENTVYVYDESGYLYILFAWYDRVSAHDFFNTIQRNNKDSIGFSYGSAVGRFKFGTDSLNQNESTVYFSKDEWKYGKPELAPI